MLLRPHLLEGGAVRSTAAPPAPAMSTATWSSTALSIWLATVRFQISS
jgi:hypothetical protein